jgi:hypothetical protein
VTIISARLDNNRRSLAAAAALFIIMGTRFWRQFPFPSVGMFALCPIRHEEH